MTVWRFLVVAGCVSIALTPGCTNECNTSCLDNIYVTAALPGGLGSIANAQATFCLDGACATGSFSATPRAGDEPLMIGDRFCGEALVTQASSGSVEIRFSPNGRGALGTACPTLTYADGDQYEAMITDANGATIFDASATATYEFFTACHPDPVTNKPCRKFEVTLAPQSPRAAQVPNVGPQIVTAVR